MLSTLKKHAADAIRQSYTVLREENNLSPGNARVTHSLTHLVRTLTRCHGSEVSKFLLHTPDLCAERHHLPMLCGQAECEMEKFWARKLISEPESKLEEFWYFSEYCELTRAEIALFKSRRFDSISFLGAGALPVTAFLLARQFSDAKITCVDYDSEASELSRQLAHKLGFGKRMDIRCMDALQYVPAENELVICASLLQGRTEIYTRLSARNCALLVRDAEGVYQFLYKPAELPQAGFSQIAKTDIDPRRINTTRYYERDLSYTDAA